MKVVAIIPARFASTRFPGKPLAMLGNKSLIQRVYDSATQTDLFDKIIVATDDKRIFDKVEQFGGEVVFTSKHPKSGTDRIAEVCKNLEAEIIINIQGDEPFISKKPLQKLISAFDEPIVQVASLMHKLMEEIENPNIVKVVCDNNNFALYFSRSPIPFIRTPHPAPRNPQPEFFKHIGVYAFRREALFKFIQLPIGKLEQIEKLEQLRLLENGIKIKMVETSYQGIGIDTPEDLKKAELILQKANSK
ncbi:MAG: 3-deoxy-manno-octulosonate cytidylyltransferase [Armatimonadetes bacterium]|nr:3-deoxy-manno-octulosonate cytidylyltransferase [Armatimonadota bacterium]